MHAIKLLSWMFVEDDSLLIKSHQLYEWSIAKTNEGNVKNLHSFAEGLPGVCWLISYYSKLIHEPIEYDNTIDWPRQCMPIL